VDLENGARKAAVDRTTFYFKKEKKKVRDSSPPNPATVKLLTHNCK